jgi:hypothetical protein
MQLTISSVDYAPEELDDQLPIVTELVREIPGDDRPDYWLACTARPIRWISDNIDHTITHLVLAARWQGTHIEPGVEHLPIGIAYVTDDTLLDDSRLDLNKCEYIAIGIASDTSGDHSVRPLTSTLGGRIARAFGTGYMKIPNQALERTAARRTFTFSDD